MWPDEEAVATGRDYDSLAVAGKELLLWAKGTVAGVETENSVGILDSP